MKPKHPLSFADFSTDWAWSQRLLRTLKCGLLAACLGHASQVAAADPVEGILQTTLSNGMTLIVKTDRRAPTAVHMLWVRVGSMDEVDGTSGVAHVLEHMLFKGTPTVPEGEFSRRVAALGGRDNAFTSHDMTAYHQQVPAQRLEEVMRLEADRFANNQWPDEAFIREIEVIKEERRQRVEDSPQARLFEAYRATAWLAHPYRRPVIGWMSDLQAMTPGDVRDFYQRWYVPANAAVVVVGDVDWGQVREWAERYYGQLPGRAVPARKPQAEPLQAGVRRMEFRARVKQPLLILGYRAPRLNGPDDDSPAAQDALALLLLANVLDGHSAARLSQSLVQQQRLADSVDASFAVMARGPLLFTLSATPAEGVAPEALEAALKTEIQRVATQGISDAELKRVKNQWAASEVFKLDSQMGQAQELGQLWAQGWPPAGRQRLLQRLRTVTSEQVRSVAARYFKDDQMTAGLLLPEVAP